jgi:hypothetical protein|tara:strand:- start:3648 stop:3836 length:189 start_codon:yes stop_codon:yes gene_type:complete
MKRILSKIFVPSVMALLFFFVLTPLAFILRVCGKDLLKIKNSKNSSYWIKRKKNINPMDRQF